MAAGVGVERVLQRIRNQIEDGAYYEAQQSYKTIYYRYKARNMTTESYKVLEEGARVLLEKSQIIAGLELANLLLEAYEESDAEVTATRVSGLRSIVDLMHKPSTGSTLRNNSAEVKECARFLNHIIKWLKRKESGRTWFAEFNGLAGDFLYKWDGWSSLGRLTMFYSRGKSWRKLAEVLQEVIEEGNSVEEDLFICRAVLQILDFSIENSVESARDFLSVLASSKPLPRTPLMNFTNFLIEALAVPSEKLVDLLTSKYKLALDRDKHLGYLLANLMARQFNRRSGGLFSTLMDELLGGM